MMLEAILTLVITAYNVHSSFISRSDKYWEFMYYSYYCVKKVSYITYISLSCKCINKHLKNCTVQWKDCGGETRGTVVYS
jgi:hypothetical protein